MKRQDIQSNIKTRWERFWIGFFEYLVIRPLARSTGVYVVVLVEYDATMSMTDDGIRFSYSSVDLCVPYVHKFNRYADALNFFNEQCDHRNNIVPVNQVTLSYFHKKKGMKNFLK